MYDFIFQSLESTRRMMQLCEEVGFEAIFTYIIFTYSTIIL